MIYPPCEVLYILLKNFDRGEDGRITRVIMRWLRSSFASVDI